MIFNDLTNDNFSFYSEIMYIKRKRDNKNL